MSKRVVIHLRPDIPVEGEFLDAYSAMPRRAEWVRRMLLRGFLEEVKRPGSNAGAYMNPAQIAQLTALMGQEQAGDE